MTFIYTIAGIWAFFKIIKVSVTLASKAYNKYQESKIPFYTPILLEKQ